VNDGNNICRNKHPQESQDDFISRTGLLHYKTKNDEVKIDDEVKPKVACDRQTNYKCATEIKSSIKQPFEFANAPEHTFKFGSTPFTVLPSVYEYRFMKSEDFRTPSTNQPPATFKFGGTTPPLQAFELAMNSGNRCIRVEVI
jgi:hypothetical protein